MEKYFQTIVGLEAGHMKENVTTVVTITTMQLVMARELARQMELGAHQQILLNAKKVV